MKIFHSIFFLLVFCNIAHALPNDFVYLKNEDPSIQQDMRYAGYHNFIGRPIAGYEASTCILTRQAAQSLLAVQRELVKKSLSLKVYDCYRPIMAVTDFMTWSQDARHDEMKLEFYPNINKADVFRLGYVAAKSGHSRGSTVDLTIVPISSVAQDNYTRGQPLVSCTAAYPYRFRDNSIDMGSGFDCLDELSYPYNKQINSNAYQNRMLLRQVMMRYGFQPYSKEWWHFTLENEPFPQTYFNFKVASDHAQSAKLNFLEIADIHFDPFTSCVGNKVCPLIEKLRYAAAEKWPQILAQYDVKPPQFRKDTNYRLLISALNASRQVVNTSHSQFVLLVGDLMGHESRSKYKRYSGDATIYGYQLFAHKIFEFLTREIAAAFPAIDVYTAVGNNDSYQGDYFIKPNGAFFNDAAILWSGLIKNGANQLSMQKQFSYAGYYSIVLPYPKDLRLIVMNTNLFSDKAKGKNIDSIAIKQLDWLHVQLQMASNAHQSVFIAMHIPQGIDLYATERTRLLRLVNLWKPQYIQRFEAELNQFSAEIAGIFAGHLHRNWFQVITSNAREIPVIGVTSISPIFGNHPGFKTVTYFTHPLQLDDFSTHYFCDTL